MEINLKVDATGLACPMPIVKAKKGMESLSAGQIMLIETTDKGSASDFPSWVNRMNYQLIKTEEAEGLYRFYVQK